MAKMRGADIIAEYLIKEKVPYLFGLCGHGDIGFLDAFYDRQDKIKLMTVRHEQAAGHMADAYFRVAHKPVATFTSCGPGSTNLPTALASAMMDSSAFLAITGNVPTSQFGRSPFQETGRHYQAEFPNVVTSVCQEKLSGHTCGPDSPDDASGLQDDDDGQDRTRASRCAVELLCGGGGCGSSGALALAGWNFLAQHGGCRNSLKRPWSCC